MSSGLQFGVDINVISRVKSVLRLNSLASLPPSSKNQEIKENSGQYSDVADIYDVVNYYYRKSVATMENVFAPDWSDLPEDGSNHENHAPVFYRTVDECILRNSFKGIITITFLLFTLSSIPHVLRFIMKNGKKSKSILHLIKLLWAKVIVKRLIKENIKYHCQIGLFTGVLLSLVNGSLFTFGQNSSEVRKNIAKRVGFFSGLSILFAPTELRYNMSLFFFLRALEVSAKKFAKERCHDQPHLLWWLKQTTDVGLMCVSSSKVLDSYLHSKPCLDPKYAHFLKIHGAKEDIQMKMLSALSTPRLNNKHSVSIELLNEANLRRDLFPNPLKINETGELNFSASDIIHGNMGGFAHFFHFFYEALFRSLPVYLPVYVAPLILIHRAKVFSLERLPTTVSKLLMNIFNSCVFLSTYCASAWGAYDVCVALFGSHTPWNSTIAGFASGSSVLLEKKHRRIELALYVTSHAIHCWLDECPLWIKSELFKKLLTTITFMWSLSVILDAYVKSSSNQTDECHLIRREYLSIMGRFFDGANKRHLPLLPLLGKQRQQIRLKKDDILLS